LRLDISVIPLVNQLRVGFLVILYKEIPREDLEMFGSKTKLEIKKELTKRQLKLALMKLCSDKTLRTVKTDSEKHAVIQVGGIANVT
jgi:hypothetical protein